MKLKKIASLALAGIMAVSMLAGCKGNESSSSSEGTVVTPVDNSLAAYINDEMTDEQKNILTFTSDAEVQAAIEKVAAGMDKATLETSGGWVAGETLTTFREMVDAEDRNLDLSFQEGSENTTIAHLYVVPGNMGETAMKEQFMGELSTRISTDKMPTVGTNYIYAYAGKVAVTKVTSADGLYSAYVIGLVIDQTATKRA